MNNLLPTIKGLDNAFINQYVSIIETLYKNNKKPVKSITAALAITLVCRYVYRHLTLPPKKLRDFPVVGYMDMIKSQMKGEDMFSMEKRLVLPLLKKYQGFYVEPRMSEWIIKCSHPIFGKKILADTKSFPKSPDTFDGFEDSLIYRFVGGKGVINTEGSDWRRHRQIINPFVHQTPPADLFGRLSLNAFNLIEEIGMNECLVNEICERMTLDAIGITAFDFNFEATETVGNTWITAYNGIRDEMMKVIFFVFPILDKKFSWMFPNRKKAHEDLNRLIGKIDDMIALKRSECHTKVDQPRHQKDLLALMLEAENSTDRGLTTDEMKANILSFFFAGHDTTASALTSTIGELARNKDIQKKAREEVLRIMGDEPVDKIPTSEQLREMEYLDCVIKETLRLDPPAPTTVARVASEDVMMNGIHIPKGSIVNVDIIATHLNPELWDDPTVYRPERYTDNSQKIGKDELKWLPFGYGPHMCLGMNFSYTEQRVFLSMLLRKFVWEFPEDSIHFDGLVSEGISGMKPKDMRINFKKRF
ncbi:cytochrome P450 [Pilobolus umbonatus]|nr:cytochrome P450 [Pilobolus umbonatus]